METYRVSTGPAIVELGPHVVPVTITHATLGLSWKVLGVLEDRTTPTYYAVAGTPGETSRFTCRVRGPSSGNPSADGEFMMIVRRYCDRAAWWIAPQET